MRKSLLLITLLLMMEVVLIGMYIREKGATEKGLTSLNYKWSVFWGGSGREDPRGIVLCKNNLYVTGSTSSFGAGNDDVFLLKYNMNGELIWNKTWGGASYDMGRDITASDDGIYVVGITYPDGKSGAFLLKYDTEGRLIWERIWGVNEGARARGVALDDEGFVYVGGYIGGIMMNGRMANETKSFLLKYSRNGDLLWSRIFGESGADFCWDIIVDEAVYIGGSRGNLAHVPARSEIYLAKFDFDSNMIWIRRWGGGFENIGWALSAWEGQILQVGYTQEDLDADVILLGYDPSGTLVFSSYWGESFEDYAWGVARGGSFIYVVGHTYGEEPGLLTDALIMKYDSDGNLLWKTFWGDFGPDIARSVVVKGDCIYIVGPTESLCSDAQAFLLLYTSLNEIVTPLMIVTSAIAIALGFIVSMTIIHAHFKGKP